jgi:hypothetical protein
VEDAWFWVAGLGFGGDGADFDPGEAEGEEAVDGFAVLVEAGGEAYWGGERFVPKL